MLVEDVMTTNPVTVAPSDSLKHALALLDRHRITSLPVVHGNRLCGVVSEADLVRDLVAHDPRTQLRAFEEHRGTRPTRVAEVMSRHPLTVHPETDLARAVDLLTSTTVKSVPVVDSDQLVQGVLSRSDVVRCYARADETLSGEVRAALASVGLQQWAVVVENGIAELSGPDGTDGTDGTDPADATLARVMASSVPGVVDVRST